MDVQMVSVRFLPAVVLFCTQLCFAVTEEACISPLGMESGDISRDQITASSRDCANDCGMTSFGRLHGNDSWYPDKFATTEWIQIDLLEVKSVTGIQTQGHQRSNTTYFVSSFKLQSSNKATDDWTTYGNSTYPKEDAIFDGNRDADTVKENLLDPPILARYIRVLPWTWSPNGVSLRLELLGCEQEHTITTTTTEATQTVAIATNVGTHPHRTTNTEVPVTTNTTGQSTNQTSAQTERPGLTRTSFPIDAVIGGTVGGVLGLILLVAVAVAVAKKRVASRDSYPVFTNPIYNKTTRPLDSNRNQPRATPGSLEEMEEFVVNQTYRGPRPTDASEPLKTDSSENSEMNM
ncbi:PREDICTED: discoidin, CUB and LCCL domain-containing protein 2-like [Branchiostoma belcheri]|uniref:Discoidin, CUB and LCCL domain-containing protein 2-like n=1 Tax=Branchiostoma belcheri TaxID=7741 RepID=A0A6P5ABX6_BRABE|nr:PREDICTED: discoidin, CUB and LCCL domain-containing protein 2-like [Branchiostoma belcheri]